MTTTEQPSKKEKELQRTIRDLCNDISKKDGEIAQLEQQLKEADEGEVTPNRRSEIRDQRADEIANDVSISVRALIERIAPHLSPYERDSLVDEYVFDVIKHEDPFLNHQWR
jgi:hypothetical protein